MKKYQLDPNKLDERISVYFGYNFDYQKRKEDVIAVIYQRVISRKISQDIIKGTLSKQEFLDNFDSFLENITKIELKSVLLKQDSVKILNIIDMVYIPKLFIKALTERFVKSLESVLNKVEWNIKSKFVQSQIIPILQKMNPLIEKMKDNGVDSVFITIEEFSKKDFKSDIRFNAHDMFFMVFLQHELRYVIQEFIIFNMIINDLENRKKYFSKNYRKIVTLLQKDLYNNIFCNLHWERLIEKYGVSSSVKGKISKYKEESKLILRKISKILREENISIDFIKTIKMDSYHYISDKIALFVYAYDLKEYYTWSYTDIGHGFKDTSNLESFIFSEREMHEYKIKTEAKALIFEDDLLQMKRYKRLIYECTQYNPTFLFDNFDDAIRNLNNETIQYFLIDIENRVDKTAGIKIIIKILEYYIKKINDGHNVPEIHVKLWSSSKHAVEQAWTELNNSKIIKNAFLNESSYLMFGEKFLRIKNRINFSLCIKNYDPKDFKQFHSYERAIEILDYK